MKWRAVEDRGDPLERPTHRRTCSQTYLALGSSGSGSSKSARDMRGGTELTSFRARVGGAGVGAALSRDRSTDRYHYCFVEPATHAGAGGCQF